MGVFYFLFTQQFCVQLCILDNFPPGVAGNESRSRSKAEESDFYSKPLKGQHVSFLCLPKENLAGVCINVFMYRLRDTVNILDK